MKSQQQYQHRFTASSCEWHVADVSSVAWLEYLRIVWLLDARSSTTKRHAVVSAWISMNDLDRHGVLCVRLTTSQHCIAQRACWYLETECSSDALPAAWLRLIDHVSSRSFAVRRFVKSTMSKLDSDNNDAARAKSNTQGGDTGALTSKSEPTLPLLLRNFAHEQPRCDTSTITTTSYSNADGGDSHDEHVKQRAAAATHPALHLRMANCNVSPESVASLSDFVAQLNTRLVRLRYITHTRSKACTPGNRHRDTSVAQCCLVSCLACCSLSHTHPHTFACTHSLSKNAIGPQRLQLLGKALVTNNTLEILELDSCELVGSPLHPQLDGLLALSKGVQSPRSTLRHLKCVV